MIPNLGIWPESIEEQQELLLEPITEINCGEKLKLVQRISQISRRELAKIIDVSEATLRRLESGASKPTDDFMNRILALCIIGRERFGKLSDAQKERVLEHIAGVGGAAAGVVAAISAVSASGTVPGISAAGIASGIAAIGGGAMLTGIGVIAAIPIATGLLGYGIVKGLKKICDANNLSSQEHNDQWEIRKKEEI